MVADAGSERDTHSSGRPALGEELASPVLDVGWPSGTEGVGEPRDPAGGAEERTGQLVGVVDHEVDGEVVDPEIVQDRLHPAGEDRGRNLPRLVERADRRIREGVVLRLPDGWSGGDAGEPELLDATAHLDTREEGDVVAAPLQGAGQRDHGVDVPVARDGGEEEPHGQLASLPAVPDRT